MGEVWGRIGNCGEVEEYFEEEHGNCEEVEGNCAEVEGN